MNLKLLAIFILYSTNLFSAEAKDDEAKVRVESDYNLFKQYVTAERPNLDAAGKLIDDGKIDIDHEYEETIEYEGRGYQKPTPLILAIVYKQAHLVSKFLNSNPRVTKNLGRAFALSRDLMRNGGGIRYQAIYRTFSERFKTQNYLCECSRYFCCDCDCCDKCCYACCQYNRCGKCGVFWESCCIGCTEYCNPCCTKNYLYCADCFEYKINGESNFTKFSNAVKKCFGCGRC